MVRLMSESEKRSLSLAVFFSKLEQNEAKEEKIIVLDDPVVSFDTNRCTSTIDTIKTFTDTFDQVIVLSHYPFFVEEILNKANPEIALHLKRSSSTAYFETLQREDVLGAPLNKALKRIIMFIKRENDNNILDDCRILIEEYLTIRYMQEIIDENINPKQNLAGFINDLKDAAAFDDTIAGELQNKREDLNPSHHNFSDPSKIEDARTYAQEVLNLLNSL